jgi:Holliday junction resolvase
VKKKEITYVTISGLAEYNKVDKELLLDFLLDNNFLEKDGFVLKPTEKGSSFHIHVSSGKYGKFLLYNKHMDLFGLLKYRKYGTEKTKSLGNSYELQIGRLFEENGYIVKYHGFEEGVNDHSIDLIAINKDEVIFIQCKNWSKDWVVKNNRYIDQKDIKSFLGDVLNFIDKRPVYNDFKIKKLFVISDSILSKDAYAFIQSTEDIDFQITPFRFED